MAKKRKKQSSIPKKESGKTVSPTGSTIGGRAFRQNLLTLMGALFVFGYLMLPINKVWLTNYIIPYYQRLPMQLKVDDVEQRLRKRHHYNYEIMKRLSLAVPDSVPLLLPPRNYVKHIFSDMVLNWFHSGWNYYFFGPRKVAHYLPDADIDWHQFKVAVIATNDRKTTIPEKEALLKRASPLMVNVVNTRGENVGLYLVPIDSPEMLALVLKEYRVGSGDAADNYDPEVETEAGE
jgi:hypothetical protein